MIKDEVFAKHSHFIEKIAIDQNRVILKDNKQNRLAQHYSIIIHLFLVYDDDNNNNIDTPVVSFFG